MDGVLADFAGAIEKVIDKKYKDIQSEKEFTEITEKYVVNTDFFARIDKYNSVDLLLQIIQQTFKEYDILSAPLPNDVDNVIKNKNIWIDSNLKSLLPSNRIFTHEKYHYAKGNILIDDYLPNLDKWVEHGGIGIKYKASSEKYNVTALMNVLNQLSSLTEETFKPQLVTLYNYINYSNDRPKNTQVIDNLINNIELLNNDLNRELTKYMSKFYPNEVNSSQQKMLKLFYQNEKSYK